MDFAAIAKTIADTFTEVGCASIGFRRITRTVDTAAGTSTADNPAWTQVRGFVLPASKGTVEAFDNRREDVAFKAKMLRYIKLAAYDLAVEPLPDDRLFFANREWCVLGCTPVNVTGATPLVYGLGVVSL